VFVRSARIEDVEAIALNMALAEGGLIATERPLNSRLKLGDFDRARNYFRTFRLRITRTRVPVAVSSRSD
jgi:hypothetical protein